MKKLIIISIVGLVVLVGVLGGTKGLQIGTMIAQGKAFVPPPEVVTSSKVKSVSWESLLTAVGSLDAVQGVTVTAEINGKVSRIAFKPGTRVTAGRLLVQQDVTAESARLRAAQATAELARVNFERAEKLLPDDAISRAEYDNNRAQLTQALAQVDNIRAVIRQKTIKAPFAGRLGIRQINLGQVIGSGQPIVTLQSLNPIFVNFLVPQQQLSKIRTNLEVRVSCDALGDRVVKGSISAINSQVDAATRNVRIQATIANPDETLRPGMYVNVEVVLPTKAKVLIIPATAVLHAPYSDSVFLIEEKKNRDGKPAGTSVRQQFVRLGEKRGDFVSVASGIKANQVIVSTGVFKLRNGQTVEVNNKRVPAFKLAPRPAEG